LADNLVDQLKFNGLAVDEAKIQQGVKAVLKQYPTTEAQEALANVLYDYDANFRNAANELLYGIPPTELDGEDGFKGVRGFFKGMGMNSILFNLNKIPKVAPYIKGSGLLGLSIEALRVVNSAANFEADYPFYSSDFIEQLNNPLIPQSKKDEIWREANSRQEGAEAQAKAQAKGFIRWVKDNAEGIGLGLGGGLTLDGLRGTFYANPFKFRNPWKSVPKNEHIRHLEKGLGAQVNKEHIDLSAGSGGHHAYENFGKARKAASINANLGDDAVPFLQKAGPYKNKVYTGMRSEDKTKGWRLDFDSSDPNKGTHIKL